MKRIYASTIGIDQGVELLFSDFDNEGPMWSEKGEREKRVRVTFSSTYVDTPNVFVNMEMFDFDTKANQRAEIVARNIGKEGFDIVFRTWGDTKIARARAAWMAIGGVNAEDNWDDDDIY